MSEIMEVSNLYLENWILIKVELKSGNYQKNPESMSFTSKILVCNNQSSLIISKEWSRGKTFLFYASCRPVSAAHPSDLFPPEAGRNWQKRGRFVFRPAPSRSIKIRPVSRDVDAFSEAGWALPVRPGELRGWGERERAGGWVGERRERGRPRRTSPIPM